jgi:predicted RNA-binding Zn ribbon-like protein
MAASTAPGRLAVVQRFINTADLEEDADEISTPAALRAWLAENLGDPGQTDEEAHARAIALREALRSLAGANNGQAIDAGDLEVLNQAADEAGLRPRFSPPVVSLEPDRGGTAGVMGRLVAAVYDAMADGSWQRLKACARHSCRWVFYDSSKNQSATWCSMRVCGNRSKAERFRQRRIVTR